jgi:hypothetical protein
LIVTGFYFTEFYFHADIPNISPVENMMVLVINIWLIELISYGCFDNAERNAKFSFG